VAVVSVLRRARPVQVATVVLAVPAVQAEPVVLTRTVVEVEQAAPAVPVVWVALAIRLQVRAAVVVMRVTVAPAPRLVRSARAMERLAVTVETGAAQVQAEPPVPVVAAL
jgi:hypothetical protein